MWWTKRYHGKGFTRFGVAKLWGGGGLGFMEKSVNKLIKYKNILPAGKAYILYPIAIRCATANLFQRKFQLPPGSSFKSSNGLFFTYFSSDFPFPSFFCDGNGPTYFLPNAEDVVPMTKNRDNVR